MKAKMKLIFSAVCMIALVCVFTSKRKKIVEDSLQLMNVEALAEGESGGMCYGEGSVDCPFASVKVYVVF